MVVLADGTTILADMGHRAFMTFDPKGEFARSVPMGGDEGLTVLGELFSDGKGGLISAGQQTVMMTREVGPGRAPGGPLAPPPGEPVVRFSLEGRGGQKLLFRAWQPPRVEQKPTRIEAGGGAMMFRGPEAVAFEPKLLSGVLPDGGLAFSDSSAYAIKITGPDGAVRRVLKRPIQPRPVTRAIQEGEKQARLRELEEGGGPQIRMMVGGGPGGAGPQQVSPEQIKQMRRAQIEQMQFYPELPVVTEVTTGWSGKIWVQRRGEYGPGPIDVLTATGEYVGSIDPKTMIGPPRAFGPDGRVAFVVRDELDIPRVVIRRLPPELR